jgi:hypothetical protein
MANIFTAGAAEVVGPVVASAFAALDKTVTVGCTGCQIHNSAGIVGTFRRWTQ